MGYAEIAILCREISIQKLGKYTACCDYYGTLDSVQVAVIDRSIPWPDVDKPVFHIDLRLDNQADIDKTIKILKGFLGE